ncbi:hypothetical protein JI750_14655 [Flavobacterium sp. GN10]|uniref:Uncharacterized protein n=1 Tax=Flavobacterium tagetis TaxID=2801336 RepID=A0ABS1KFL4_9FLAO|nr:hypothetical protein [Flavobacterium tagetis]MBL0738140.1 hypothetical protein [Flavobacterium tagetis]
MIDFLLKHINPQYVIIGGALLTVFGSYLASEKADKESAENGQKVSLIKDLTVQINKLSVINKDLGELNIDYSKKAASELDENKTRVKLIGLLSRETKKLAEINNVFAKQNIEYSKNNEFFVKQLQEKTDELNRQVTGGDSYPYFDVAFNRGDNKILLNVYNNGDVKLENVNMEIRDNVKRNYLLSLEKVNLVEINSEKYSKFFEVLYPNNSTNEFDFNLDGKFDNIELGIDFKFGNRHIIQYIFVYNYKNLNTRLGEVKIEEKGKTILHYTYGADFVRHYLVK